MPPNQDLRELAVRRGPDKSKQVALRRRWWTRYGLPGVLLAGFVGLTVWAGRDWFRMAQTVPVQPAVLSQAQMQTAGTSLFKAAGWIEPRPTPIHVPAMASGVIKELFVVEDQAVEAGEVIARLDPTDAKLKVRMAKADRALKQATRDRARATLHKAQLLYDHPLTLRATLASAEAEAAQLQTALAVIPYEIEELQRERDVARQDFEGKQKAAGTLSEIALIEAKKRLEASNAAVDKAQECRCSLYKQLAALERQVQALREQLSLRVEQQGNLAEARSGLAEAEAALHEAEVAVAVAELELQRMQIHAPVRGRVYQLLSTPGLRVGISSLRLPDQSSAVVSLYQPERLQVRVDVRFEDLPKVRPGQPVRMQSPAFEEPLQGQVFFLGSEADIQKNTLLVKVVIDNPPPVLKPEMLVEVTFIAPEGAKRTDGDIKEDVEQLR